MHTFKRFLVATLVPALIVSIFAVSAVAAHGSSGKVELCHWASSKFVKITVAMSAEPAHLGNGDVEPDEYGDCSGDHEGNHEGNTGDNDGDNDGDHEGNSGGTDGDPHHCTGARAKSEHVGSGFASSGKSHGGSQGSNGKGDKSD